MMPDTKVAQKTPTKENVPRCGETVIAVLIVMVGLTIVCLFPRSIPPYMDYDSSTLAIYTNNLSERGQIVWLPLWCVHVVCAHYFAPC